MSRGTEEKWGSEALHTDDQELTAGAALRQLFIKPLKEHNQVICAAFCFRLFFFSVRGETEDTSMNKSEAKKRVKNGWTWAAG